jgi:hypothetical protein
VEQLDPTRRIFVKFYVFMIVFLLKLVDVGEEGQGLDRSGSEQGQVAGCYECGDEPSGSVKCGEFCD